MEYSVISVSDWMRSIRFDAICLVSDLSDRTVCIFYPFTHTHTPTHTQCCIAVQPGDIISIQMANTLISTFSTLFHSLENPFKCRKRSYHIS